MKEEVEFKDYKIQKTDIINALAKIISKKRKAINVHGASTEYYTVRSYDINTENIDFDAALADKEVIKIIETDYTAKLNYNKNTYESLRKKADAVLFDVKSYQKLIESIEDFDYRGATAELGILMRRYTDGTSAAKAKYRARLRDCTNIKCN